MSVTAVCYKLSGFCHGVVKIFSLVHSKNRAEFLVCKLFRQINAFYFADQNLASCRSVKAGKVCYLASRLSDDFCVKSSVDEDSMSYHVLLFVVQEIRASCLKFFLEFVVNVAKYYNRLLGSTNHTVIKRFRM